jgi:hypothetical protein
MKTITIKTQAEWNALPDGFDEYTEIQIKSDASFWLKIDKMIKNAYVVAWESSHVEARESSHVEARGSSHVEAWESSHVVAWGSSHVEARESSHVEARESSHVEAWESSHVVAWESSHVEAHGSSHVVAWESSHVVAWGSSHVVAWGSSHVEARESSHVEAWGSSHVVARESSHVVAWGSSHVEARESSHVEAWESSHVVASMNASLKVQNSRVIIEKITQQAVAICLEQCTVKEKDNTARVIVCPRVLYDIKSFADIYKDNLTGKGKIILYKSVNPKTLCDFHTGKIKYEGTVTCPDFDPDPERECGGGLHLSPMPELALKYNNGKVLKCEVALKDIVVYGHNIDKVRCKKVKVVGEVKP